MSTGLPDVLCGIIASYISDLELDDWVDRSKLTFEPLCDRESGLAEYYAARAREPEIYLPIEDNYPWSLNRIKHNDHKTVRWDILSSRADAVPILKANLEWVHIPSLKYNIGIYTVVPKAAIVKIL